jgi:alkylated DNA repair dioxygenase AlkB
MKIVRKNQTREFKNNDQCIALEYSMGDKDINGAVGIINGRYPDKGRVVNTVCKELVYVLSGTGRVVIEGKEINFKEGDLILIEPNEKYFWEGSFKIFMPCAPAWYPEQHRECK